MAAGARAGLVREALVRFAFTAAIIALNPFNLSRATEKVSVDVFNQIIAPFYHSLVHNRIVVVTISDKEGRLPLDERPCSAPPCPSSDWPISFREHAQLIRAIIGDDQEARPKAIFVDVLFNNRHNDKDDLTGLAALASGNCADCATPVIFATQAEKLSDPARPKLPAVEGVPSLLAADHPDAVAQVTWLGDDYPLMVSADGSMKPTPATMLYRLVAGAPEFAEGSDASPMVVMWGYDPPQSAAQADAARCAFAETLFARVRAGVSAVLNGILTNAREASVQSMIMQPCAFHVEIPADELVPANFKSEFRFRELLRDSYVFIGADIAGAQDVVRSPVHGELPGVYFHAMAFDNLMTYGANYFRPSRQVNLLVVKPPLNDLVEILLIGVGVLASLIVVQSGLARTTILKLFLVFSLFLVCAAAVAGAAVTSHIASINWVGAFLSGAINIFWSASGKFEG